MTRQCALKRLIELMKIEEKIKKAHEQSTLKKISPIQTLKINSSKNQFARIRKVSLEKIEIFD